MFCANCLHKRQFACKKCQFSGKNKKIILSLSLTELAQRVVKVNVPQSIFSDKFLPTPLCEICCKVM